MELGEGALEDGYMGDGYIEFDTRLCGTVNESPKRNSYL